MNQEDQIPVTLQEALNTIKFLKTSHREERQKWKDAYMKQTENLKKLELNRKKELEFLSNELQKYELNLSLRNEDVARQLAEKEETISKQEKIIEELNKAVENLRTSKIISVPEINIYHVDSNSDSGIALDSEEITILEEPKSEVKPRRCRRFAESFFRRVDFSPIKYKPSTRDTSKSKKEESRKNNLEVSNVTKGKSNRLNSNKENDTQSDCIMSDSDFCRNTKNDSMNNHFSDDGSEDTSEEVFDRVMTRSSMRRSVKANPKYKKINRTKSKLLEQMKLNVAD